MKKLFVLLFMVAAVFADRQTSMINLGNSILGTPAQDTWYGTTFPALWNQAVQDIDTLYKYTDYVAADSVRLGTSSTLKGIVYTVKGYNPPSVPADSSFDTTFVITGASTTSSVYINPPTTFNLGLSITGWVKNTDSVTVRIVNPTGAAKNPDSAGYKITIFKF